MKLAHRYFRNNKGDRVLTVSELAPDGTRTEIYKVINFGTYAQTQWLRSARDQGQASAILALAAEVLRTGVAL